MLVATAASSANSMSLMRTLRTFVLALRRERWKNLPPEMVRMYIIYVVVSKACFSGPRFNNRLNKIPKSVGADAALFDATADFEWLQGDAVWMGNRTLGELTRSNVLVRSMKAMLFSALLL